MDSLGPPFSAHETFWIGATSNSSFPLLLSSLHESTPSFNQSLSHWYRGIQGFFMNPCMTKWTS